MTVSVVLPPCVNDALAGEMVIVTGSAPVGWTVTVRLSCPKAEPPSPIMERVAVYVPWFAYV